MDIREFFESQPVAAVAFSGGCDSAYLLYAAKKYGGDVHAYYVRSQFQPQFEYDDAVRLADKLNVPLTVIEKDVLSVKGIAENPADRCYYCKKALFGEIKKAAFADGYELLLDGTNASDDISDRPGTKAAAELSVRSPLRECGLTKDMVRSLSEEAGLFTWNKPAYACLATRIRTGEKITAEKLISVDRSESFMRSIGFSDFRVRVRGRDALVQLRAEQFGEYEKNEEKIVSYIGSFFDSVTLDPEARK